MNSFSKLNLRTKLVIGFSAVITFTLVISGAAFYGLNLLNDNAQKMYDKDLLGISYLRQMNRATNEMGRVLNRVVIAENFNDDEGARKGKEAITKLKGDLLAIYEKAKPTIVRAEVKARMEAQAKNIQAYYSIVDRVRSVPDTWFTFGTDHIVYSCRSPQYFGTKWIL